MRPIIKSESHGYFKPDGNPMTGGKWASITFLAHKEIPIESLTDNKEVTAWLTTHYCDDSICVDAYLTSGYDTSTNYAGCEVDEWFDDDAFCHFVEECPLLTQEEKTDLVDTLDLIASDTDGYTAY